MIINDYILMTYLFMYSAHFVSNVWSNVFLKITVLLGYSYLISSAFLS